jgi:hypothetical protein
MTRVLRFDDILEFIDDDEEHILCMVTSISGQTATISAVDPRYIIVREIPVVSRFLEPAKEKLDRFRYRIDCIQWMESIGVRSRPVISDGNCFAVSAKKQLRLDHSLLELRARVANHVRNNAALASLLVDRKLIHERHQSLEAYLRHIETDKAWFDDAGLLAFAHAYQRNVVCFYLTSYSGGHEEESARIFQSRLANGTAPAYPPLILLLVAPYGSSGHFEPCQIEEGYFLDEILAQFPTEYFGDFSQFD